MYCATKAFDASFRAGLSRESKAAGQRVDCIVIVPGDVVSDSNNVGLGKWCPAAKEYGKMILDRVDAAVACGRLIMSPYWLHWLQIRATDMLPEVIVQQAVTDNILFKKRATEEQLLKFA